MGLFESVMATQRKQNITMETAETLETSQSDKNAIQGDSKIRETKDTKTEMSVTDKTVVMETEDPETNQNQIKFDSDSANLDKNQTVANSEDNSIPLSDENVIDKAVSEVTMEIVEETLNAVENADERAEETDKIGQIDDREHVIDNICDPDESAEINISETKDIDRMETHADKDRNMEIENTDGVETDSSKDAEVVKTELEPVSERESEDLKTKTVDEAMKS